jgi:hypothetical protein
VRRYDQLIGLIAETKPATIIEIGTHRGARASLMIREALKYHGRVVYYGFDVFETEDAAFHDAALNGKGIPSEQEARSVLNAILSEVGSHRFDYHLTVGDTRETMRGNEFVAGLAFIDGDHRVETIRSDYAAVHRSSCVVFDDYLVAGPNDELPDLTLYGANAIVDSIPAASVLPITDYARQGWGIRCAVVRSPVRSR